MSDLDIMNALVDHGWDAFHQLGNYTVKGLGLVQVVHRYTHNDNPERHYGETSQGWTGEASIVFHIAGRHFKKLGTVSSYFDVTWDGKFFEVNPRVTEVIVYE